VGHDYNVLDEAVGAPAIALLESFGAKVLFAHECDRALSVERASNICKKLNWTFNKELIGALDYYKNHIDGVCFMSTFPCGPDALVNELAMRKIKNAPSINLIIDEAENRAGLTTRIESFCDILLQKKYQNNNAANKGSTGAWL
jgi:predicted nucleotide-binding protein (sugar kinase/HSP70/actin superfamily)